MGIVLRCGVCRLPGGAAAQRGRRGGQPSGLDGERIIATAVRLLDAEGPAGFSMRRLATERDVTAMSVYWYVDTKDDLLELALDKASDEMRLPAADSDEDWCGDTGEEMGERDFDYAPQTLIAGIEVMAERG